MDLHSDLTWRGLVNQSTHPDHLGSWLSSGTRTLYAGFDPTSDSLHVGSLLPVLLLRRFQKAGHKPIPLVGGATGMIGDPSGKSEERNLLSLEQLQKNVAGIEEQLRRLLDFQGPTGALLLNNFDWMRGFSYLDFLRDVGKHFPVNAMLAKDSVKGRLERESGISYTEFSYMLLQAYDFVYLNRHHGCELQIGGSDQWGNITAGIDLARRMHGVQLYGMTCPLLLKADGTKMGKTERGAIYLSAERTTPAEFYQYWLNIADADCASSLRFLTELPHKEIEDLDASRANQPELRESQKKLAEELTRLIHKEEGLREARNHANSFVQLSAALSSEGKLIADPTVLSGITTYKLPREKLSGQGLPLVDAFIAAGLAVSKSEVRRLIEQGGCYVNNVRRDNIDLKLTVNDLSNTTDIVLRSGKKKYALLRFE